MSSIIYPALILTAICLVVTFLLTLTNYYTRDKIKDGAMDKNIIMKVLRIDSDQFEIEKLSDSAYKIIDGVKEEKGFIFIKESKGYGGPVRVMTGLTLEGKVSGVQVLSSNETPGLGKKSEDDNFLKQFVKETFVDIFQVVKIEPSKEWEVESVTGATISSKAVTTAVNEAIAEYKSLTGGIGQ
jgi:electron transport complex protein RnfG